LPQYSDCCKDGLFGGPGRTFVPTTFDGWSTMHWPKVYFPNERAAQLKTALSNATAVYNLASVPYPAQVSEFYIVGGGIDTPYHVYLNPTTHFIVDYRTDEGDGTVSELSASNSPPDSPYAHGHLAQSFVSLHQHYTVFDDDSVRETLKRILLTDRRPSPLRGGRLSVVLKDNSSILISSLGMSVLPAIAAPGADVDVSVTLSGSAGSHLGAVDVTAVCVSPDGQKKSLPLLATAETFTKASYVGHCKAGSVTGPTLVRTRIPGIQKPLVILS